MNAPRARGAKADLSSVPTERSKGTLLQRGPLRHDLHARSAGAWASQANQLLGCPKVAPIYPWPTLARRVAGLATSGRRDCAAFFRHGTTKYNVRRLLSGQHNTVLTDLGRAQARDISNLLPSRVDVIACSALARAIETMELAVGLPRLTDIPVIVDPRLNEVNLGSLQGRRRSTLNPAPRGGIDYSPEHGESYRVAAARVLSFVVDLFDAVEVRGDVPMSAAVFCHAGVLRIVATLIRPVLTAEEMFEWRFENASRIDMQVSDLRLPPLWVEESTAPLST